MTDTRRFGATTAADRITSLDVVRGVAVLGILTMNVVSFALPDAAYFNIDASSPQSTLDWIVGAIGEIFADQKFMGMFSMLFGAGIVLFADRAASKTAHPVWLSLWRNFLLLLIGIAHSLLWPGDVLTVYALCAPVLIAARRLTNRTLVVLGVAVIAISPIAAVMAQATVDESGSGLGDYWFIGGEMSDTVGLWLLADFGGRALGMMLIGVAAFRTGFLTGSWSDVHYRRTVRWGLGVGLPLAALGFAVVAADDFGPDTAVIGSIPNTIGTLPTVAGYVALITLWHRRHAGSPIDMRLSAAGRMALTNYLTQTLLGALVFWVMLDGVEVGRAALAVFVAAVWALQLWWSPLWLGRFRSGPFETLWRAATYRRW